MKLKRLLASGLVVAMMTGMLTGCGGGGDSTGSTSSNNSSSSSSSSSSGSQSSGDTSSDQASNGEIVNLKWITIGNGMPTNYDSWIASVNEYIGEKIGVNLEMEVISWGDWGTRRNVIVS